jgi:hypothetical protein
MPSMNLPSLTRSMVAAPMASRAGFLVYALTTPTPNRIVVVTAARYPSMEKVSSWK